MIPSKIAGHTRYVLESCNDSDIDSISQEICQLVDYGVEVCIPVLKTCFDCFTARRSQPNTLQLEKAVSMVFKRAIKNSNLETLISHALEDVEITLEFVDDFTNALDFSISEKIGFGLALADFERSDAKSSGLNLLLAMIDELCANSGQIESTEQIHSVLMFLQNSEDFSRHLDSLTQILSSAQPRDAFSFALTPILSQNVYEADVFRSMDYHNDSAENEFTTILAEIDREISVGDLAVELGCGFTIDAQQCEDILSIFAPLSEATISRVLGGVARTCADLENNHTTFSTLSMALGWCIPTELSMPRSWNVDILVETIKQLAHGTSWRRVIENLDYDGFYIPNMESFLFFMRLYKTACKDPFPLDAVCSSVWKNMEGQLAFLKHAISAPPEVFTFTHSPRKLEYIDNNMHSHEQQLGLSNHSWLSLDLLDVLCQLAERGHYVLLSSLLQYPLIHCPRTLLLGMTHIKTAYSLIQREVVSAILPAIITNSLDSVYIFNLWHQNAELFLWGILNAQNLKADSMLRIIEICHEVKILSAVLDSVPISFSIRLAVLASLRGFLDITNWLPNCLYMHKDLFAEECLKFVKNVHFCESEDFTANHIHSSDPLLDLHLDATVSLLKVLKAHENAITSSQLVQEIEKVNAAILDCNSKLQNDEAEDSSAFSACGDDDDVQPQQKNALHIGDHSKVPNVPSNEAKPLPPSPSTPSADSSVTPKNPSISTSSSTSTAFGRPNHGATLMRFGSAFNIGTLVAAAMRRENAIEVPPSDVQDKINLIFNNISAANIESKKKEFTEILPQHYYPWFAQYLVMKRASIEAKFHDVYLKFLDKVNSKLLFKEILQNTYENCKVLLGSELIKSSSEERSLLKNLGSWLGKLTIERNYVLRAREIDPKSSIVEAYEKGLMIAVIPFTSKVLEPCQNSIAYQPPNPWTMAILGLLAEIYSMPNLKMNLKFDIEVLFKNLGVDIKQVVPTSLLKDRKRELDGNPDFSNRDLGVTHISQPQITPESKTISPLKHIDLPFDVANLLNTAVDIAIKEIVSGVVWQSVCIACQTTKEIVLKDYALEPDEPRIYNAAHLMVASLAGSLAHVTCMEPLRTSISGHLRSLLQGSNISHEASEQIVQLVISDSLDLGCGAIAQAATRKAMQTIDADIAQQLSLRRKHRDGAGSSFFDSNILSQNSVSVIPESLHPKQGHLSLSHHRVYEDFVQLPWQKQSTQALRSLSAASSSSGDAELGSGNGLKSGSPKSLQQLINIIRNPVTTTAGVSDSATRNEKDDRLSTDAKISCNITTTTTEENSSLEYVESDPEGFQNRVSTLFENWYQICEDSGADETACSQYVLHLHQTGLLEGGDTTESFFRILLEYSVAHCSSFEEISSGAVQSPQQSQNSSFLIIDVYGKLVFSVLKYFPEPEESSSKLFLLFEIIAVTVRSIQKDAEDKRKSFYPRPYFRLFINWLLDLCSLHPGTDGANFQILTAFANAFHALQPLKIPAFSFAWLELVSHRSFMPKLLTVNGQKGWPYVQRLLVDLLQFLEPSLFRNAEPGGPVHFLYKGTLRVFLLLLHDFPEFLCGYHFTFCDVIPSSCIQIRNIILSSFPRNMRLPDPFTLNLKIDLLPEIVEAPCILSEIDAALKENKMKNDLDEYLTSRQQSSTFLSELKQKLLVSSSEGSSGGNRYCVSLINSLVLYTGMQAIQQLQAGETRAQYVVALQIFKYLSIELDTEGRYLFLNAIANQLRYPNRHTHYFSFIMLYLFLESDQVIKEQITRVLLERLIVNRPHPWGILITFIELIKNPKYGFWNYAFIKCAPEIEKIFESVAKFKWSQAP